MKTLKAYRFFIALIIFLLIALCISALSVRAGDSLNTAEPAADAPAESSGFEPGTVEAKLGEWVYEDINSDYYSTFTVYNASKKVLKYSKAYYFNPESNEYEERDISAVGNISIPFFRVNIPDVLFPVDSIGTINIMGVASEKPPVQEEPHTAKVKLEYIDEIENKIYEIYINISVKVVASGKVSHISDVSPFQDEDATTGSISIYMNKDLVSAEELKTIKRSDFKVKVTDPENNDKEIELIETGFQIDTAVIDSRILEITFNAIPSTESEKVYNVSVQYLDEEPVVRRIAVYPSTVKVNVPSDGNVAIKVVDQDTQKPIQGATVRLTSDITGEITKTTGADGYVKTKVALAQYSLVIEKDGYETQEFAQPDLTKELVAELSLPGDLPAGKDANVQVVVTDQDGKPVEGAIVRFFCPANGNNGTAATNGEGIATLNLKRNNYEISIACSGHFSASKTITVNNKEEFLKVTLERRYICNVTTTVLDENGRPVSGAEVYFTCPTDNEVGKSTTNSQGKTPGYIAIRANDYVLKVSKSGYETYERNVRVSESNSDFTVTLERPRYDDSDDDDDDDDSSSNSGSGYSGSSSGSISIGTSGSSSGAAVNSQNQVAASEINRQITQAIQSQISAGQKSGAAEIKVKNAGSITANALSSIRQTVLSSKGTAKLLADSTAPDGKLTARLYIDPEKSSGVRADIKLGVSMEEKDIQKTSSTFEKYFDNNVSVVHFDHQGAFGMEIDAAVKVDLSKLNTQNLMFYSYNPATNRYTPIANPKASIDQNGFLHFTTNLGGDLIITDKPLARRS